jgi:hypothetical protein
MSASGRCWQLISCSIASVSIIGHQKEIILGGPIRLSLAVRGNLLSSTAGHMRFFSWAILSVLCLTSTWALRESDVGVVDWHKSLIGIPLSGSLRQFSTDLEL